MPFQPGNAEGAKSRKAKPYADALRLEIAKADGDVNVLRRIAERHVARCMEGDMSAIKELADRIDGKVPQALVGDNDHDAINIKGIGWLEKTESSALTIAPASNSSPSTTEPNDGPAS